MNVFDFLTEIQKRKKREVYSSELGAVATDLKNPQKKYTIINMMLGAKYILTPLKYKRHGQKVDCYSKRNLGDSPPKSPLKSRLLRKKRYWNSVPCHVLAPNCLSILSYRTVKISEQNILILS